MIIRRTILPAVLLAMLLCAASGHAEEKRWSGGGDGTTWSDDDNWFPDAEPSPADDVVIDSSDAAVTTGQTFEAKSITIGEHEESTLTVPNFIYGDIAPAAASSNALMNSLHGKITLQGAGIVTVEGKYLDSETALADEPSFIFWVE